MKILFLGTGASMGVPIIGCKCKVCRSNNFRNRRLRSTILIESNQKKLLVDVSPDIRQIALKRNLTHFDGVLITHFHEDHIGGMDDLRRFYTLRREKRIPLLMSDNTCSVVSDRFAYMMDKFLDPVVLKDLRGEVTFQGVFLKYFTYSQQTVPVTGFRFDNVAYVTDIKDYPESIFNDLRGVEILILGAIQEKESTQHFSFKEAIHFHERVGAQKTYLIHMSHEVDYSEWRKKLPRGVSLSFDGLVLDV